MKIQDNKIILDNIPVSVHTSKYRFKRRTPDFSDYLILQEDKVITAADYIEWQISYDIRLDNIYKAMPDAEKLEGVLGDSKPQELKAKILESYNSLPATLNSRGKKAKFMADLEIILKEFGEPVITKTRGGKSLKIIVSELSDYFRVAIQNNIITPADVAELLQFATQTTEFLSSHKISRETSTSENTFGWTEHWEKHPLWTLDAGPDFFIEIIKKHMQYAIGYQSMIYLCAKTANLKDAQGVSILGKHPKDITNLNFVLDKNVILKTMKAFMIASENHKQDMVDIIQAIVSNPNS